MWTHEETTPSLNCSISFNPSCRAASQSWEEEEERQRQKEEQAQGQKHDSLQPGAHSLYQWIYIIFHHRGGSLHLHSPGLLYSRLLQAHRGPAGASLHVSAEAVFMLIDSLYISQLTNLFCCLSLCRCMKGYDGERCGIQTLETKTRGSSDTELMQTVLVIIAVVLSVISCTAILLMTCAQWVSHTWQMSQPYNCTKSWHMGNTPCIDPASFTLLAVVITERSECMC